MKRAIGWFVIGAAVLAVGAFVWPTRYRAIDATHVPRDVFAARENRFTGVVELLTPIGWFRLEPSAGRRMPSVARDTAAADPLASYRPGWQANVPRDTSAGALKATPRGSAATPPQRQLEIRHR